jgi:hypothetical protein
VAGDTERRGVCIIIAGDTPSKKVLEEEAAGRESEGEMSGKEESENDNAGRRVAMLWRVCRIVNRVEELVCVVDKSKMRLRTESAGGFVRAPHWAASFSRLFFGAMPLPISPWKNNPSQ